MRKFIIILLFFCLNTISCAYGQEANDIRIVVISSLRRVLQDDIDVDGTDKAEIYCAKAETESFQIIIANNTATDLANIDLRSGNWSYSGNKPADPPELRMFREHYVEVKRSSGQSWKKVQGRLPKGMYPDALIPFVNPYTGKRIVSAKYLAAGQNIKVRQNQGYWIDISVGSDVQAGIYTNTITILSAGKEIAVIPIKLTVWDFELPDVHELKTFFSKIRDVSIHHRVAKSSLKYKLLEKRYFRMLRDHGVSLEYRGPSVNRDTGQINFTPEYVYDLKSFVDQMHPPVIRLTLLWYSFTKDPIKRAMYLSNWEKFIQQNSWLPQPIVYVDLPSSIEDYLEIIDYGRAIDTYAPSIKLLVTGEIMPKKPGYPNLEGSVDIWVVPWSRANTEDIYRRQQAGDQVWSYGALVDEEQPNWVIDFPLLNYRIPAWFSWSMDLKGILYWQTTGWSKKDNKINPWLNYQTYYKGKKIWNGEGSLVYPGYEAGIEGPVASMRLKVFRDSVEDYDYFTILSNKTDSAKVKNIVKDISRNFKIYSKTISHYLKARTQIATEIVKCKK